MTDLDFTGQRANSPGLTKEARKAEDAAKWKARRQAFFAWCGMAWKKVGGSLPKAILLAVAAAIVIAASTFDWWMSARGWVDLLPGIGVFGYIGAAASVGFWYLGVHFAFEKFGEKDKVWGGIWTVVSVAAYIICITGVVIATATNTSEAQRVAKASRTEFATMIVKRDALQQRIELNDPETLQLALDYDVTTLAALIGSAKSTHGMPDLDAGSGCPAPPKKFTMERLCAQANGGIDPFNGEVLRGLRQEIKGDELAVKRAKEAVVELAALNEQIKGYKVKTGDATAEALGWFLDDAAAGNVALLIVFIVVSGLFLFCGAFFSHWLWTELMPRKAATGG